MKRYLSLLTGLWVLLALTGCGEGTAPEGQKAADAAPKAELLIYCGITMANPIKEIAQIIEKEQNVKILISQGGSEDLYKSLAASRKGDLYLPGSASYREKHLSEGLLGDFVHVGYNQSALVVKKGNPKNVQPKLEELERKDLVVGICNPDSGSIGRETKKVLDAHGNYQKVVQNSSFMMTDSRNLNRALKAGDFDLTLNWRATAFFPENRQELQVIDLEAGKVEPKKLLLNLLTFSQNEKVARRFMEYAVSPEGQAIFRRFGFLDKDKNVDY